MTAVEKTDNVIEIQKWVNRADAWMNLVTGQGVRGRDKSRHDFFASPRDFTQAELEDLYRGDAIAGRIIDVLPNDMLRAGFQVKVSNALEDENPITPEEANKISAWVAKRLADLKAKKQLKRALKWDRLYGGSVAVMFIDDGKELDQPVDVANVVAVSNLRALHRFQVTEGPRVTDPRSDHFGEPEFYTVAPGKAGEGDRFAVHADRILRFQTIDLPPDVRRRQLDRFGDSVFVRSWEALSDFQMAYRAVSSLMADFSQAVWGIPHLHEMVLAKRDDLIQRRIAVQDYVRSTVNAVMVDTKLGETFERKGTPVAGLAELLDRLGIRLSAATGMPITLLLGVGPKGFSTDDQSGQANWDDVVSSEQDDNLLDQMMTLVGYLFLEKASPTKGQEPDTWGIEFNPLVQQDAGEIATTEKTVAERDAIYLDWGVLNPSEVRSSRFTSEGFSQETTVDPEVTAAMAEKDRAKATTPDPEPPPTPPPVMVPVQAPPVPPGEGDDEGSAHAPEEDQ